MIDLPTPAVSDVSEGELAFSSPKQQWLWSCHKYTNCSTSGEGGLLCLPEAHQDFSSVILYRDPFAKVGKSSWQMA